MRDTPIQNLQPDVFFAALCNNNGGGGGCNGGLQSRMAMAQEVMVEMAQVVVAEETALVVAVVEMAVEAVVEMVLAAVAAVDFQTGTNGGGGQIDGTTTVIPNNTLSVYPNPSTDKINISVILEENVSEQAIVRVQNIDGKVFYQKPTAVDGQILFTEINLKELPPGMYFITVQSGKELLSKKLLIN